MSADELKELTDSIRERGLIEPIELFEGKVLDGRHRLKACAAAGCEPRFVEFTGGDPWLRVWDRNGARREFTGGAAQKYAVWRILKTGSDEWQALQNKVAEQANAARSEKAKARPRKEDGTLASAPTDGGLTGSKQKGSSNAGAKAKATAAGVSHVTVGTVRSELESIGQFDQCERETKDGRTYPAERERPSGSDTLPPW